MDKTQLNSVVDRKIFFKYLFIERTNHTTKKWSDIWVLAISIVQIFDSQGII